MKSHGDWSFSNGLIFVIALSKVPGDGAGARATARLLLTTLAVYLGEIKPSSVSTYVISAGHEMILCSTDSEENWEGLRFTEGLGTVTICPC